jgi:predicted HTH domain antitoxin
MRQVVMGDMTISLNLPRDLLSVFNVPESQLSRQILELLALNLFQQRRISAGKGGEMLGISKWEFIQLLGQRQIAYFNETPDELSAEIESMELLLGHQAA